MKRILGKIGVFSAVLGVAVWAILPWFAPQENVQAATLVDTPWGPERETFTWENPAGYAVFNSITNNPTIGDERDFVRIREKGVGKYGNLVNLEAGKTYEVYIYYHNNADANDVGQTALGIADGVGMRSSFPATIEKGKKLAVTATIVAADTNPLSVWDGAYVAAEEDFYLRYVPGSARIHNGGALNGQAIGPEALFGDGALLGYNKLSGLLPGCNEYAGYVTYEIKADKPAFTVAKTVVGGETKVEPGKTVEYKVRYENTGTMAQENVVLRDILPEGMTYVYGSSTLKNNNNPNGVAVNDDIVADEGVNIGNYGENGWAELTYKVKIGEKVECGKQLTNGVVASTDDGNKQSAVTITVAGSCLKDVDELPYTGPAEVILAILVVLGIGAGGMYWWQSRRMVKMVTKSVAGDDDEPTDDSSQN